MTHRTQVYLLFWFFLIYSVYEADRLYTICACIFWEVYYIMCEIKDLSSKNRK